MFDAHLHFICLAGFFVCVFCELYSFLFSQPPPLPPSPRPPAPALASTWRSEAVAGDLQCPSEIAAPHGSASIKQDLFRLFTRGGEGDPGAGRNCKADSRLAEAAVGLTGGFIPPRS